MTSHLTEDQMIALLQGNLAADARDEVKRHHGACASCADALAREATLDAGEKTLGADAFLEFIVLGADQQPLRRKLLAIQAKKQWTKTDRRLANQVEAMQRAGQACLVVDYTPDGYFGRPRGAAGCPAGAAGRSRRSGGGRSATLQPRVGPLRDPLQTARR